MCVHFAKGKFFQKLNICNEQDDCTLVHTLSGRVHPSWAQDTHRERSGKIDNYGGTPQYAQVILGKKQSLPPRHMYLWNCAPSLLISSLPVIVHQPHSHDKHLNCSQKSQSIHTF